MKVLSLLLSTILVGLVGLSESQAWTVLVVHGGGSASLQGQPLKVGMKLQTGQTVKTGAGVKVKLQEGFSIMVIGENSEVSIETSNVAKIQLVQNDAAHLPQIFLKSGKLRMKVEKDTVGKFRYRIPSVVAGVRGTEFFLSASAEKEVLCVLEGEVGAKIISSGAETRVEQNIGWIREGRKEGILVKVSDDQRQAWKAATDIPATSGAM